MSIAREYEFRKIDDAALLSEASTLGLESDWAGEIIQRTKSEIFDAFADAGREISATTSKESVAQTANRVTYGLAKALSQAPHLQFKTKGM